MQKKTAVVSHFALGNGRKKGGWSWRCQHHGCGMREQGADQLAMFGLFEADTLVHHCIAGVIILGNSHFGELLGGVF